jgi:hypothetical protein
MVFEAVVDWKQRRRPPLAAADVATTIRGLAARGWLPVAPSPDLPLPDALDLY